MIFCDISITPAGFACQLRDCLRGLRVFRRPRFE
nr:MAG TPA: Dual specificity protein phosphatase, N-terminal half [Caudoviricetes sp.]